MNVWEVSDTFADTRYDWVLDRLFGFAETEFAVKHTIRIGLFGDVYVLIMVIKSLYFGIKFVGSSHLEIKAPFFDHLELTKVILDADLLHFAQFEEVTSL